MGISGIHIDYDFHLFFQETSHKQQHIYHIPNGYSENSQYGFHHVSKVGLLGEKLQLYTDEGSSKANWTTFNTSSQQLKWYKVMIEVCKEVYTPTKCLLFLLHYKTVTSLPISRNLMRLRGVILLH